MEPHATTDEKYFRPTDDGPRIYWKEWAGPADRPAILCLPGLTRNTRDFEALASHLSGRFRVLAPSFRGRGKSDRARDPMTYVPLTYVADMTALLAHENIRNVVIIGTSLGGIVGLLMANTLGERVRGLVMNDIGPEIDPKGLARIGSEVGKAASFASWEAAATALAGAQGMIYPDWSKDNWAAHARRLMTEGADGRIVFDYDPGIAEPFKASPEESAPDLWLPFGHCPCPILAVRGAISDILSTDTLDAMTVRHKDTRTVSVPRVGHAPTLDEPEARDAIDSWLGRFIAG